MVIVHLYDITFEAKHVSGSLKNPNMEGILHTQVIIFAVNLRCEDLSLLKASL